VNRTDESARPNEHISDSGTKGAIGYELGVFLSNIESVAFALLGQGGAVHLIARPQVPGLNRGVTPGETWTGAC